MSEEHCILNPDRDCLGLIKATQLEKDFQEFKIENSKSHQRIFDRIENLEKDNLIQGERYRVILEKIDIVTKKVEAIEEKPAKKWESLSENVLWAIIAAVIGFVVARLGITG